MAPHFPDKVTEVREEGQANGQGNIGGVGIQTRSHWLHSTLLPPVKARLSGLLLLCGDSFS